MRYMDIVIDAFTDAMKDGLLSVPVLFVAYLFMELLEKSQRLNEDILRGYSRKLGPFLGGILGIVPQCGISGAAAALFSTGSVTLGTMLAVFFATSDEMLPIMLSSLTSEGGVELSEILYILLSKAALGILLGYIADIFFSHHLRRLFREGKDIHSFCEQEHCECEEDENIWKAALVHTVKIAIMLIGVGFVLNIILSVIGIDALTSSILGTAVAGPLILALFGLIPNCSISVVLTESYIAGIFGIGGLFAGLLSNAGIGLIVLFRTNRNLKENLAVSAIMYILSAGCGILLASFVS